jgi:hypothetical protein
MIADVLGLRTGSPSSSLSSSDSSVSGLAFVGTFGFSGCLELVGASLASEMRRLKTNVLVIN